MFSTAPDRAQVVDKKAEACVLCHASEQPLVRVETPSRARVFRGADGAPDARDDHPDLQRAGVQHRRLPRASRDAERPRRPRRRPRPRPRRPAGARTSSRTALLASRLEVLLIVGLRRRSSSRRSSRGRSTGSSRRTRRSAAMDLDHPIEIASSRRALGARALVQRDARAARGGDGRDQPRFTRSLEAKVEERTEQLRPAHQKLMQADRLASLGQLAASVAHEINNPLSGRPQPLDAHAADPEGGRRPAGAGGRVPRATSSR